ncbi:MAG: hypothetical protein MI919_20295, partial [Holophagales bacterium]|nr:hypothetical protein [Holophagales bacterium]
MSQLSPASAELPPAQATAATPPDPHLAETPARTAEPRPWQPLLEGDDAVAARKAVEAIAEALTTWPAGSPLPPDLGSGSAGLVLFYTYLALHTQDERWADAALAYLEPMIETLPGLASWPSLYSGFTGPAWAFEHARGRLLEDDGDPESSQEIHEMLLLMLDRRSWPGDYDLINGLVGFGVYALEAWPHPTARQCLERVLALLEARAEERPGGVSWHTGPELLPEHQLRVFPEGYYNLGLAHGVPAVAALLAATGAAGVQSRRARSLLEPSV